MLNFVLFFVQFCAIILTRLTMMQLECDKAESFTFVQILNACVAFPQTLLLCIHCFNN